MKILSATAGALLAMTGLPLTAQERRDPAGSATAGVATTVPATPLESLETNYAADRAAVLRQVLARYVEELDALEKSLAAAGDASGAARVRLERDRVLPALGLPAVAEENADEFAAFEDPPASAPPLPSAPEVLPRDLDAILQSLAPVATAKSPGPAGESSPVATLPGTGSAGRGTKRQLRLSTATLNGTFDPVYPWQYWLLGRTASWTLNGLPAGSYQIVFRYACDAKTGGGKATVSLGDTSKEVEVTSTGNWKRKRELVAGPFVITDSRADLIIKTASLNSGASYLMDLTMVLIQPENPAAKP